jgi:hypothetical protein
MSWKSACATSHASMTWLRSGMMNIPIASSGRVFCLTLPSPNGSATRDATPMLSIAVKEQSASPPSTIGRRKALQPSWKHRGAPLRIAKRREGMESESGVCGNGEHQPHPGRTRANDLDGALGQSRRPTRHLPKRDGHAFVSGIARLWHRLPSHPARRASPP